MISDVLVEAVAGIDRYLDDENYDQTYSGQLREQVLRVRNAAATLAGMLDTPPDRLGDSLKNFVMSQKSQAHFLVTLEVSAPLTNTVHTEKMIREALDYHHLENIGLEAPEDKDKITNFGNVKQVDTMLDVVNTLLDN